VAAAMPVVSELIQQQPAGLGNDLPDVNVFQKPHKLSREPERPAAPAINRKCYWPRLLMSLYGYNLTDYNLELVRLMKDLSLSRAEVAKHLDVSLDVVHRWIMSAGNSDLEMMPESYLRLLKYALMRKKQAMQLI